MLSPLPFSPADLDNPKNPLTVYVQGLTGEMPRFITTQGFIENEPRELMHRATVWADQELGIRGYGDARSVKEAEKAAAFDAAMLLAEKGLLGTAGKPPSSVAGGSSDQIGEYEATLSTGAK